MIIQKILQKVDQNHGPSSLSGVKNPRGIGECR